MHVPYMQVIDIGIDRTVITKADDAYRVNRYSFRTRSITPTYTVTRPARHFEVNITRVNWFKSSLVGNSSRDCTRGRPWKSQFTVMMA